MMNKYNLINLILTIICVVLIIQIFCNKNEHFNPFVDRLVSIDTMGRLQPYDQTSSDVTYPIGAIIMWNDPGTIPEGWVVCDGNGGILKEGTRVPDLRGRFPIMINPTGKNGLQKYEIKDPPQLGGEATHNLTIDEMPNHRHQLGWEITYGLVGHGHWMVQNDDTSTRTNSFGGNSQAVSRYSIYKSQDNLDYTDDNRWEDVYKPQNVGNSVAHNNMPPYYALIYIIKYAEKKI